MQVERQDSQKSWQSQNPNERKKGAQQGAPQEKHREKQEWQTKEDEERRGKQGQHGRQGQQGQQGQERGRR